MLVHRSLGTLGVVVSLASVVAGCSDPSVGTVQANNGGTLVTKVTNPMPGKCHMFAPQGADAVTNQTGIDIVLHDGTDCADPKGKQGFYLATQLSANAVVSQGLWHSFSTVGWLPPVSP